MTAGDKQWTASNTQFEGGMGIDATVPFGYESDFLRPVYPVDRVKPEDFFTEKGHRERQVAHARLGAFARADGAVTSAVVGDRPAIYSSVPALIQSPRGRPPALPRCRVRQPH